MEKIYKFKITDLQNFILLENGQAVGNIHYDNETETFLFEFKGIILDLHENDEFLAKEKALRILVRKR